MRQLIAAAFAAVLVLQGCGRSEEKAEPAPEAPLVEPLTGFSHLEGADAAGYYRPVIDIVIGDFRLNHVAVGAPSDFAEWEAGRRDAVYGPIILHFDNILSPTESNELGENVHADRLRVLPTAYRLTDDAIAFRGSDPRLGEVAFDGVFAPGELAKAKEQGSSGNTPVLLGALTLGEHQIRNQRFTFWAGD